jgi:hypothetical protein
LPHESCGNGGGGEGAGRVACALVAEGEKGAIFARVSLRDCNWTTYKSAELVEAVGQAEIRTGGDGIDAGGLGEVVGCVELVVAEEFVDVAVKAVRARLGDDVEDASAGAAELRGRRGGNDLKLVDDLDGRCEGRLALAADDDGDAIKENLVGSADASIGLEVVVRGG